MYRHDAGEETLLLDVEPSPVFVDGEGVVRFNKSLHDSEGIFVDLLLVVDFVELDLGFLGELVLLHMVEVGGFDGAFEDLLEDLLLQLFAVLVLLHCLFII